MLQHGDVVAFLSCGQKYSSEIECNFFFMVEGVRSDWKNKTRCISGSPDYLSQEIILFLFCHISNYDFSSSTVLRTVN